MCVCSGFNWVVRMLKKIVAEARGTKADNSFPPLLEFTAPESLKVITALSAVSRGQNLWAGQFLAILSRGHPAWLPVTLQFTGSSAPDFLL